MHFDSRLSPFEACFSRQIEEMNELGTEKNQLNELNRKGKAIKFSVTSCWKNGRMFMRPIEIDIFGIIWWVTGESIYIYVALWKAGKVDFQP